VEWDIRYRAPDGLRRYTTAMRADAPRVVEVSEEEAAATLGRGVTVTVTGVERQFRSLLDEQARSDLEVIFALYLRQYPTVAVHYEGARLDPTAAMDGEPITIEMPPVVAEGGPYTASLEIVEWRIPTQRRLYFCDAEGFPLDEVAPGVQAPKF